MLLVALLLEAQVPTSMPRYRYEAPARATSSSICAKANGDRAMVHAELWLVSENECETACTDWPQCTAYEYATLGSDHRGYKRCELQAEPVSHGIPANGYTCKVKVAWTASTLNRIAMNKLPGSFNMQPVKPAVAAPPAPPPVSAYRAHCPPPTKKCPCCQHMGPGVDLTVTMCTDLTNGDFTKMNLEGAVLEEAIINCAVFDGAILKGTDFKAATGTGVSFQKINGEGMGMEEVKLAKSDFTGARLVGSMFELADVSGSKFGGAVLDGAGFQSANVAAADFTGATMAHNADFTFAKGLNTAVGLVLTPPAGR